MKDQHLEIGLGVLDFGTIGDLVKSKSLMVTLETSVRGDDPKGAVVRSRDVLQGLWG